MTGLIITLILSQLLHTFLIAQAPDDVDPFIGTSNSRWMFYPGPCMPFGMVKLSPDNQGNAWCGRGRLWHFYAF